MKIVEENLKKILDFSKFAKKISTNLKIAEKNFNKIKDSKKRF